MKVESKDYVTLRWRNKQEYDYSQYVTAYDAYSPSVFLVSQP